MSLVTLATSLAFCGNNNGNGNWGAHMTAVVDAVISLVVGRQIFDFLLNYVFSTACRVFDKAVYVLVYTYIYIKSIWECSYKKLFN